jgi:hypothetical protein
MFLKPNYCYILIIDVNEINFQIQNKTVGELIK